MIDADDLAQVLGIEARRERRRADQIAEQHGELPAFGNVMRRRLGQCGLRFCRNSAGKFGNRSQQFSPMPEQDADVLEILIGQMAEYRDIDSVLGKPLGILGHSEFLEPVRDLRHHDPSGGLIPAPTEPPRPILLYDATTRLHRR